MARVDENVFFSGTQKAAKEQTNLSVGSPPEDLDGVELVSIGASLQNLLNVGSR